MTQKKSKFSTGSMTPSVKTLQVISSTSPKGDYGGATNLASTTDATISVRSLS
jgi:hypothetical protein